MATLHSYHILKSAMGIFNPWVNFDPQMQTSHSILCGCVCSCPTNLQLIVRSLCMKISRMPRRLNKEHRSLAFSEWNSLNIGFRTHTCSSGLTSMDAAIWSKYHRFKFVDARPPLHPTPKINGRHHAHAQSTTCVVELEQTQRVPGHPWQPWQPPKEKLEEENEKSQVASGLFVKRSCGSGKGWIDRVRGDGVWCHVL